MLKYFGPLGDYIENLDEKSIKDIFFNTGEDYWKQGGGDSCFEIEGVHDRLIFFYEESYGFFIMQHPDYLVTVNKEVDVETVEHRVGGERMNIPTCSCLSRENAYKLVCDFITNKSLPTYVEWVDLYDIDFDHGF